MLESPAPPCASPPISKAACPQLRPLFPRGLFCHRHVAFLLRLNDILVAHDFCMSYDRQAAGLSAGLFIVLLK